MDYAHLLDCLPAITYIADVGAVGRWHYVSPQIQETLGYSPEEWRERPELWAERLHPDDRQRVLQAETVETAEASGSSAIEYRLLHRDGHPVWIRDHALLIREPDGSVLWHGVLSDITDRKQDEAELERRAAQQAAIARLGEHALKGVSTSELMYEAVTRAAEILDVEAAAVGELAEAEDAVLIRCGVGWPESELGHRGPAGAASQAGYTILTQQPVVVEDWQQERRFGQSPALAKAGTRSGASVVIEGRRGPFGVLGVQSMRPRCYTASDVDFLQALANVLADAIERQQTEDVIRHRALHDALTGLPNRVLFLDRLEHALARGRRTKALTAIMFLDLDRFKLVNDGLGHQVGDELLAGTAPRLRLAVRESDTVARFGGDEFAVMLEDISSEHVAIELAERIAAAFARPFELRGREHFVTASIGIAVARNDQSAEELIRDADAAMYRAKDRGGACYEVFDELMRNRTIARLGIENDLRRALERNELWLAYQPIVSLETQRMLGVEALVRWQHPKWGTVPPAEFIPVAEETGMIQAIGQWVLERACADAARWQSSDSEALGVSVNLSAVQLANPQLPALIDSALREASLDPGCLSLELTESVILRDTTYLADVLSSLTDIGVRLALDDFGTGYSSLAYLTRLPLHALKIDRSFVDGLGRTSRDDAVTSAVLALARALKLIVVAEGVETADQARELSRLGCRVAQGFFFARPMPAAEITALLSRRRPALKAV